MLYLFYDFSFSHPLVKPYIIKHPENVSAVAGEDIRLGCVAAGKPQPELR